MIVRIQFKTMVILEVLDHSSVNNRYEVFLTTVILVVEKLKQESQAAYLSNLMNMQIRTFDVEGQNHAILMTCHAAQFESRLLTELTVQILSDLELYRILKNDADSGVPSVK